MHPQGSHNLWDPTTSKLPSHLRQNVPEIVIFPSERMQKVSIRIEYVFNANILRKCAIVRLGMLAIPEEMNRKSGGNTHGYSGQIRVTKKYSAPEDR
jgi:hypothetical protein